MVLLLQFIIAHLLGDFLLQCDSWVKDKESRLIKSPYLYLHILIHAICLLVLVRNLSYWVGFAVILVTHYGIDLLKLYITPTQGMVQTTSDEADRRALQLKRQLWFFIDQALHLVILAIVWYAYTRPEIDDKFLNEKNILKYLLAFVFITKPTSVIIKTIIAQWMPGNTTPPPATTPAATAMTADSLKNAGEYIGYIERILTLIMVIKGQWEAIGFLVAAKSVFRIGDVRDAADKKMTEYILIGTLLSFGIAILTGGIISKI